MGKEHNAARRHFLGRMTLSVGGIAVASLAPVSLLQAAGGCSASAASWVDPCGDWTLDDMCGAYPPYAFRTGAAVPHTRPLQSDLAGADWHWFA